MKKDAYFFPHFCNARHDRKLKRIQKELGVEGYGIFFMLLEVLREQTDFKYPMADIDLLADEFGTSEQKIRAVICNYGLFDVDADEKFISPKLVFYLQPYIEKTKRAREAANLRWHGIKNPDANALPEHSHGNSEAMQGEERRGENKKDISSESSDSDNLQNFGQELIQFVTRFQETAIREHGPSAPKLTKALIKNGCDTIDKLSRLDKFNRQDVFEAIRWGYKDQFWRKQILSLANIRVKKGNGLMKFQNLFNKWRDSVDQPIPKSLNEQPMPSAPSMNYEHDEYGRPIFED